MAEYQAVAKVRAPIHPGELMAEILHEHMGLSTAAAAGAMRVPRRALHRVLSGAGACSPDMALRFCALAGGVPEMFLRMQEAHDLRKAKKRLGRVLAAIAASRAA
jgi:addiction module HigA family antidote